MRPRCRLTASIPDGLPGSRFAERHRSECLTCQADEVRNRALLRDLASLRDDRLLAPALIHARVMTQLGPQEAPSGASSVVRRVAGGAIAAAAIGAAAVFGEMARRRARVPG